MLGGYKVTQSEELELLQLLEDEKNEKNDETFFLMW